MRDDTLASRTKFPVKETNRFLARLRDDRWVRCEARTIDVRLNDFQSKPVSRNYWYIDAQQVVNLLKYKMFCLRELCEKSLRYEVPFLNVHLT